jgi:murein DD-endopeptidase MepM/ murein hydrolase activator NlpD
VDDKKDNLYGAEATVAAVDGKVAVSGNPSSSFTVEYVHIEPHSVRVKVGDHVKAGQVLCTSGNVGFAPEPHLHFEVHRTDDLKGPSVRFEMADTRGGGTYMPQAGRRYGEDGQTV